MDKERNARLKAFEDVIEAINTSSVVSLDGAISLIRECDNKFLEQLKEKKE